MFRSWLQLFRVPNLFTVPGDPLAGFLLAWGWTHRGVALLDLRAAWAVLASLCFYCAGLVMNDLADAAEDRRERPNRPIPRGDIAMGAAAWACVALSAMGVLSMWAAADRAGVIAAVLLLACIAFYNGLAKRIPVFGALVMGSCRALSLLLGSVACTGSILPLPIPVFAGGAIIALYIAGVTNLARHETKDVVPLSAKLLPILPLLLAFMLAHRHTGLVMRSFPTTIIALALVVVAAEIGRFFRGKQPAIPPMIGTLIRVLLPIQAALCLVFGRTPHSQITAAALIALIPASYFLGKRFYAS